MSNYIPPSLRNGVAPPCTKAFPLDEGFGPTVQVEFLTPEPKPFPFSQNTSLADLSKDYQLFSHAAFFTRGFLPFDPLDELASLVKDIELRRLELPLPLLRGLDTAYNQMLYLVSRPHVEHLSRFLAMSGGICRSEKFYWRPVAQSIPVPDILVLRKLTLWQKVCPCVDVLLFGVDSNEGLYAWKPALQPPLDLPALVRFPAEEETCKLARAFFGEQERPYDSIDTLKNS